MNPEDAQLREMNKELARAAESQNEPRCIVRAFVTPKESEVRLTMQQWIDLEEIHSPLLRLEIPEWEELKESAEIFCLSIERLTGEEAVTVAMSLVNAVVQAFAITLPMRPSGPCVESRPDGFGSWLPLMAFLEHECHKSRAEARAYPVAEAFALLAGSRRNQGWEPKGETYAQRDVLKEGTDA